MSYWYSKITVLRLKVWRLLC